jgi:serine/threonine protein phosphatase PrpC
VAIVVCDGVSSSHEPQLASRAAADTAIARLVAALDQGGDPVAATLDALAQAGQAVEQLAPGSTPGSPDVSAPACTYVSALVNENAVTVGWAGDSRAYWLPAPIYPMGLPPGVLPVAQLTVDDSWATEMVALGELSPEAAYADPRAHAITRWLGADAYPGDPHVVTVSPGGPGAVLVCTDGLWNYLSNPEALAAAATPDLMTRPAAVVERLVRFALDSGGMDNVTVVIVPCPPQRPATM